MEINIFCITLSLIMAVILVGIGVQLGRCDKGESNGDTDTRVCVPDGDRDRGSNNGRNKRMEAEEVINGLQIIRMAASRQEKEYIDYACECVAIREKMLDKLIENMKGEKNGRKREF